jgi:hypothetical protein
MRTGATGVVLAGKILAPAGSDNPSASTQALTSSEGYGALLELSPMQ